MKKRMMACFIGLCMVLTLLLGSVTAAPDPVQKKPTGTMATVYLDGSKGDDNNSGESAAKAVKNLDKAFELVAKQGTVYVCYPVSITNESMALSDVTFKRADGCGSYLFYVSGVELTLSNVTMDGGAPDISNSAELIQLQSKATLTIEANTKLINNSDSAVGVYSGSVLNMNGGLIQNNSTVYDGGGIYLDQGTVNLRGGEISQNTAEGCGGGICNLGGTVLLDGTIIKENVSVRMGGGVYLEGLANSPASFEMKSGSIIDNGTEDGQGAGIAAFYNYMRGDTIVIISGGTISGNKIYAGDEDGFEEEQAITLNDNYPEEYDFDAATPFAQLKLSGSPTISGDVVLLDWVDYGPQIEVTGAFTPGKPVSVIDSYGREGRTVVTYAQGLTPKLEDFTTSFTSTALTLDGQTLQWINLVRVRFYQLSSIDATGYQYKNVYVLPDQPIASNKIPAAADIAGYSRIGWQYFEQGTWKQWNMETPITTKNNGLSLYEIWRLNAPAVSLQADQTNVHISGSIKLTATPSHVLKDVTYTYEWYKDGTLIDGETAAELTATESGSYTVKVTAVKGKAVSNATESAPVVLTADHQFGTDWQSDNENHWHVCTCGEKADAAAHTSDEGKVTKPATETEKGVKTYSCTVCGKVLKTEEITATGSNSGADADTGDSSNLWIYLALILLAAGGLTGSTIYARKKESE